MPCRLYAGAITMERTDAGRSDIHVSSFVVVGESVDEVKGRMMSHFDKARPLSAGWRIAQLGCDQVQDSLVLQVADAIRETKAPAPPL